MENWHGCMVPSGDFAPPRRIVECDAKSRPEYHDVPSHEYRDHSEVVMAKVALLAKLLREAQNCVAYTGAGLSVSSGLADYATKAAESVRARQLVDSRLLAQPNKGHRILCELHRNGFVKRVFNQNHDGLLQKAGLPQSAVNEIHGSFFDPSNPGGFELREDLVDAMFQWADRTDLCLALGTSLSGLNADRIAYTPAQKRLHTNGGSLGLIIVALQKTQLDNMATLRIFAPLNDVMTLLSVEMGLPETVPPILIAVSDDCDVFCGLPYDDAGHYCEQASLTLDVRVGSRVKVTMGNFGQCHGVVAGKNSEGHYLLKVCMDVGRGATIEEDLLLGSWWIVEALAGRIATLPVVQGL